MTGRQHRRRAGVLHDLGTVLPAPEREETVTVGVQEIVPGGGAPGTSPPGTISSVPGTPSSGPVMRRPTTVRRARRQA